MRVYLLMEWGGYDESDKVLGVFAKKKDAVATMKAIEATPWESHKTDHGIHRNRAADIEGYEWGFSQYAIDYFRPKTGAWPPRASVSVVEHEVSERALAITANPRRKDPS